MLLLLLMYSCRSSRRGLQSGADLGHDGRQEGAIYTYTYIYIYMCIHTYVYVYVYIEREREIYTYIHMYTYIYTYNTTYIRAPEDPETQHATSPPWRRTKVVLVKVVPWIIVDYHIRIHICVMKLMVCVYKYYIVQEYHRLFRKPPLHHLCPCPNSAERSGAVQAKRRQQPGRFGGGPEANIIWYSVI